MVLVIGMALGAISLGQLPGGAAPAAVQGGRDPAVDERATRIRERLGGLCGNFDFFFRHEFANGEMRPVRCSRTGREKTLLVLHSFSDRRTKQAWLAEWGQIGKQRGGILIRGKRWTVEVLLTRWEDEVRARL